MKLIDIYSPFIEKFEQAGKRDIRKVLNSDDRLKSLRNMAMDWGMDLENVERWMRTPEYEPQGKLAKRFIGEAHKVIHKVESVFGATLEGELRLSPSLMRFDGFARYDSGYHTVWFGVDHPDANDDYLRVLLCHELSHVYRDHQPRVWAHLGKPLKDITRDEYLEATDAKEHLVSEGLATLFSQLIYPETPLHVHHYYFSEEMQWCLENFMMIEKAIRERLKGDEDVWSFYSPDAVAPGSPSRTQYFWAARVLRDWIPTKLPKMNFTEAVVTVHGWPAADFDCF